MHELSNHTPHPITVVLVDGTQVRLPSCPPIPRYTVERSPDGVVETVHGRVPLTRTQATGAVIDLPPVTPGVLRIVARGVAEALPERADLAFPDDLVRDDDGRVLACRALGRIATAGIATARQRSGRDSGWLARAIAWFRAR